MHLFFCEKAFCVRINELLCNEYDVYEFDYTLQQNWMLVLPLKFVIKSNNIDMFAQKS